MVKTKKSLQEKMLFKTIIVTGSVGSGKTTLSKKLSRYLGFEYLDVSDFIKTRKLYESYDAKKKCVIVDERKLALAIKELLLKLKKDFRSIKIRGIVIDSHMSHYIEPKLVDICIVTKCELKEMSSRLKSRGYKKDKISENIEAETFDVCLNEAKEEGHDILIVDCSHKIDNTALKLIANSL